MTRRPSTPVACRCRYRHRHGTRRMYVTHRCGCFDCRVAHARSVTTVRAGGTTSENRYIDGAGTRRRVEALAAAGYSHADVARHMGVTKEAVAYYRTKNRVHVATAARVAAVYDTLTAVLPPVGWRADRTRKEAAARGYLPPLAWDDDEIDDPNAEPHTPTGPSSWDLAPCGTPAAARRHHRRGETLDDACRNASRRATNHRKKAA